MNSPGLKHLLDIEGLSKVQLEYLLENAQQFVEVSTRELKKVPALRGKTIVNLFLEPSTRTRASFEIAGKRLSADTINLSGSDSSVVKGETLLDTARNLEAMAPDVLVIRHKESGAPHFLAKHLVNTAVVNAGDGLHEHPTQALLDVLTMWQHFDELKRPRQGLKVAIVGDVRHSRVARSNIWAHQKLGNKVTLVGPPTLVPREFSNASMFGGPLRIESSLAKGIEGADVVMVLRMQLERQSEHYVPTLEEYSREYCVSERVLSRWAPESIVLHPGPANRGTEISGEVLDGKRSFVHKQVNNGVAVRMAVLLALATLDRSAASADFGGVA